MRLPQSLQPSPPPPPPNPPTTLSKPRLILYYQTHNNPPLSHLLHPQGPAVTHIILAALHINHPAGSIHLNDHPPTHPIHSETWREIRSAQAAGISVLILLGGAARGSFTRLDGDAESFEEHYTPLRDFVRWAGLDGVDLDVEEGVSLAGMVRLVMRLRRDFGVRFLITAAPVASALLEMAGPPIDFRKGMRVPESREEVEWRTRVGNMSGFSYQDLEKAVGGEIAWYNAQFYCGWGSLMDGGMMYCAVLARGGWDPRRIVVGTVTNPWNGAGWTSERLVRRSLRCMVGAADDEAGRFCGKEAGGVMFGGMMGWEYFNCVVARDDRDLGLRSGEPWLWAERMRTLMDAAVSGDTALLEESWDEKAAVWTGRFLEGGFGGSSTTMQDKKGRWIAV